MDGSITASLSKPSASLELKCGSEVDVAVSASLDNVSIYVNFVKDLEHHRNECFFINLQSQKNAITSVASVKVNEKQCTWTSKLEVSNLRPSIHVDLKCTPNHHVTFLAELNRISDNHNKVALKLTGLSDFNVDAAADTTYYSIDNFNVIVDLDAPKANLNKARLEVKIKPKNSEERGVQVKASNNNKNILSGSADYSISENGGKTSINGRGDVKWYDEAQTASFDLVHNVEDSNTGESGSSVSLNYI